VLAGASQHRRWTWHTALKRASQVLRDEGVKSLWFRILGETVYRRVILMERPLDEPIAEVAGRLPVVIDLLKATEVDEYASFRLGADSLEVRHRLAAGQWAFVARHEGRIVHAGWTTTKRAWIDFLAREIALDPGEVYQYESFTAPAFRGQNLAAVRIIEMMHYFRKAGYRRMVAVVVPGNTPAFRPLEKAGYRPFGLMGYVQIGRWRRNFCRVNCNSLPPGGGTHTLSYTP
jgi:GNAT superfamily N-acetyltransferase